MWSLHVVGEHLCVCFAIFLRYKTKPSWNLITHQGKVRGNFQNQFPVGGLLWFPVGGLVLRFSVIPGYEARERTYDVVYTIEYIYIWLYEPNLFAPVKWSWTVHEWFLNSSCAVHEHLFMNSSWTIHEHEMAKFMKLVRFMNLEFISLSSWTCEFMNYSWTIVHE